MRIGEEYAEHKPKQGRNGDVRKHGWLFTIEDGQIFRLRKDTRQKFVQAGIL